MLKLIKYSFFVFIIFLSLSSRSLETDWSPGQESQVRLVSPLTHNNNDSEIIFGLEYKLKKDWKTYWKSPGEGGFPQEINWQSSENLKDLEILWPTPDYFEILDFTSIGYVDKVVFPLKIKLKDINKKTIINLNINYLTCKDICIPGKANLELLLPPGEGKITEHYFSIQKNLSLIPKQNLEYAGLKKFSTKALEDNETISIIVSAESDNIIRKPSIFLHSEFGLPIIEPKIQYSSNLKKINAKFDFNKKNISKDKFILNTIFQNQNNALEFVNEIVIEDFSNFSILNNKILYIIIISLIGGLILNIMPCVLPVISIKILSVLKNTENKISVRNSFFITSLGIIFSFILLSISLIFLRYLGVSIGWGMQFQQPVFLIIIALILLIFSLNMFGFFEFQTPSFINSKFIKRLNRSSYLKDFFNGFFATILATPCSAPFVGTAITAAFTQSSYYMLGIFLSMGLGMSLPYLFFAFFPNLTTILPKPGYWMQYVKYFLGTLLLLTFIWICSILFTHYNFFYNSNIKNDSNWLDFTSVNLENLKKENSIIFVDITADWCATCQFNKINVLNSEDLNKIFDDNKIIKVRGDWTKSNKKIEDFLQTYNKFGIPFNIIYTNHSPYEIILSELLQKEEIIQHIKDYKEKNKK